MKNNPTDPNNNTVDAKLKDNPEPANLTIHSIFIKDLSYEAPSTPQAFSLPWEPQVKFDIQVMRREIDANAGIHEVVLHTTVVTTLKLKSVEHHKTSIAAATKQENEEVTAFLIEIKLAGLFTVKGIFAAELDRVLSTTAPTILFPYVSENIASLVARGGFPQFILPPIDFATLYQQKKLNSDGAAEGSVIDQGNGVTIN